MRVNNVLFNKAKRSGFLTKVEVISRQAAAQTDYQILAEDIISQKGDGEDIQFFQKNEILNHWLESYASGKSDAWAKLPNLPATKSQILNVLSGNPSASNGVDTFDLFDDFEGVSTSASYLTGWTKSGNNPLKDLGVTQGWFCACYNDYDGKFYLYIQGESYLDGRNTFKCYSFLKADAETPANWTDHGAVFTASESWENGWVEPHSIIWETQSMADAREGVGAGEGTRKWRIYYCAKPSGGTNYATGFAIASESAMTTLTAYSGNPVYPHDASYTYPDCKAVVYNDEVWMLIGRYIGDSNPQNSFFTHSSNGIDNWTDCSANHLTSWLRAQPVTVGNGMVIWSGLGSNLNTNEAYTEDGETLHEYSSNPVLTNTYISWSSVAHTKDYTSKIDNYYYYFYICVGSGTEEICLAKTQTVTQEETVALDIDKWTSIGTGDRSISNGVLCIDAAGGVNTGIHSKTYNHSASGAIIEWKAKISGLTSGRGIGSRGDDSNLYKGAGGLGYYGGPDYIKVWDYTGTSAVTAATINLDTWYRMRTELHPTKLKVTRLDDNISAEIANTLASHQIGIYAGYPMYLDFIAVRKYASSEALLIKRKISGKAGIIKSVCGGIAG